VKGYKHSHAVLIEVTHSARAGGALVGDLCVRDASRGGEAEEGA